MRDRCAAVRHLQAEPRIQVRVGDAAVQLDAGAGLRGVAGVMVQPEPGGCRWSGGRERAELRARGALRPLDDEHSRPPSPSTVSSAPSRAPGALPPGSARPESPRRSRTAPTAMCQSLVFDRSLSTPEVRLTLRQDRLTELRARLTDPRERSTHRRRRLTHRLSARNYLKYMRSHVYCVNWILITQLRAGAIFLIFFEISRLMVPRYRLRSFQ